MNIVANVTANRLGGPWDTLVDAGRGLLSQVAQNQITSNIDRVIFFTAYSQPVSYTGQQVAKMVSGEEAGSGKAGAGLMQRVKPTIIVSGPFGTKTFAPYGEAKPDEYEGNQRKLFLVAGGALLLAGALGYVFGVRRGRRSR